MKAWLPVVIGVSVAVSAGPVRSGDTAFEFDAVLRPAQTVEVSSASIGLLAAVEVDRGDRVRTGQVLAVLDSDVEIADLAVLRARAESGTAVEIARLRYERSKARCADAEVLARDGVLSVEELEEFRTERDLGELDLQRAREERRVAELEVQRAEARLGQRTVKSSIDGVVVERHMAPGELVSRTQDDVILTIAQLDPLHVDVRVPQSMLTTLRSGTRARLQVEAPFDREVECTVASIDPVLDAASGSLRVRLTLPNPDHGLPAGLRCRVRFLE